MESFFQFFVVTIRLYLKGPQFSGMLMGKWGHTVKKSELFGRYPLPDRAAVRCALRGELECFQDKVVVLDDDPTGIQTVHDLYVYTGWDMATIREAMAAPESMFFILTNSRAFDEATTTRVHEEIAENLLAACRPFLLVSRGDSTLRGHYPLETEVLRGTIQRDGGSAFDGEIICPFFPEGGRFTAGNIHYVADGERLVPAGETEFAADKTFGYKSSDLTCWVEEKTRGRYPAKAVTAVSLEELRAVDYAAIERKLAAVSGFGKVVVNALDYTDLEVFVTALLRVMRTGKRFLVRSAAALVKVLGGVSDKPLLTNAELRDPDNGNGGLIIAGSHVKKTTAQLEVLCKRENVELIELNQHLVTDVDAFEAETRRVIQLAAERIAAGKTVVVQTRRERFDLGSGNPEDELRCAAAISEQLTSVVTRLPVRPSFLIAKGGITSSDVGTKGLGVRRAKILGQILPGVPVWRTGPESRFPGLAYVIFPGNVGDASALLDAVEKFRLGETATA